MRSTPLYILKGERAIKEKRCYIAILYIITLLFCFVTGIILVKGYSHQSAATVMTYSSTEPVLIIDPGHGGEDGGAVAADGTKESTINLSVSMKMKLLSDLLGIKNEIIRESESLPYPESTMSIADKKRWDQNSRLDFINSIENAVLISIHQNTYPDSRPKGPQVLYNGVEGASELGNICHDMLNAFLCPDNRRVATPVSEKIFLMKKSDCPAILVECGFISNPSELKMLLDEAYQKKISAIILASYLEYIC